MRQINISDGRFVHLFGILSQEMGPEFIRMLDEPQVVLELPGSIVVG